MSKKKRSDVAPLATREESPTNGAATLPALGDSLVDEQPERLRELLEETERRLLLASERYAAAKAFLRESETRSAELRKVARHVVAELRKGNGAEIGALAELLRIAIEPPVIAEVAT